MDCTSFVEDEMSKVSLIQVSQQLQLLKKYHLFDTSILKKQEQARAGISLFWQFVSACSLINSHVRKTIVHNKLLCV